MSKTKAFQARGAASKAKPFKRDGSRPDIAAGMKKHWEKKRQKDRDAHAARILEEILVLRDHVADFFDSVNN